ncbi:hypothetical protein EV195_10774 [Tenacibaculum skagerrakense]|uniref:Uncharacterized protein n=1 Tax=Tenacibaculum skagerrakense TaxID=186571 RepID=A0A4R2NPZ8_9FLAO|nr:hypothetical protein [Tenacibaculum skagerrakense]TCP23909.1 hypothetical protein EV195_10774 [Tenacibaculum skagerrakense]
MELTKEQITYIDDLLYESGIKFWDIRIEMLDHVVSELEQQPNSNLNFKTSVFEVFKKMGWKENFNGSNFEELLKQQHDLVSRKMRTNFNTYNKKALTNPVIIGAFILCFYLIYQLAHYKIPFKYIFTGLYIAYITPIVYLLTRKKYYKLLQLTHASTWAFLGLSLLNMFIYIPKVFLSVNIFDFPLTISLVMSITIVYSYLGFKFFYKEFKKANDVYKKLMTL